MQACTVQHPAARLENRPQRSPPPPLPSALPAAVACGRLAPHSVACRPCVCRHLQSAAKRYKVTGSGKVMVRRAGKQHLNEKQSRKTKRNLRCAPQRACLARGVQQPAATDQAQSAASCRRGPAARRGCSDAPAVQPCRQPQPGCRHRCRVPRRLTSTPGTPSLAFLLSSRPAARWARPATPTRTSSAAACPTPR